MAKKRATTEVVIGAFYQRSENPLDVVFTVSGGRGVIHGYNVKMEAFSTTPEQVLAWTQLAVNDFPNSSDPRLPYAYDLHWDIKHVSQLRHLDSDERAEVETLLVQDFGVKSPFRNIKALARAVSERNDIENEYVQNPLKDKTLPAMSESKAPNP